MSENISRKISFFMLVYVGIVVLFHSEFRYYYPVINDLTVAANAYFFCVSAFFFYRPSKNDVKTKLKRRVSSLLLPYLLWNLIYLFLRFFQGPIFMFNVVQGFTVNPLCTPSWYLVTLFIMFLPAALLEKLLAKKSGAFVLIGVGAVISIFGGIVFAAGPASLPWVGGYIVRMFQYVLPYSIGAALGSNFDKKIAVGAKNCISGILFTAAIIVLFTCNLSGGIKWFLCILLPLTLWEAVPEACFGVAYGFQKIITGPAFFLNMSHCLLLFLAGLFTSRITFLHGKYVELVRVGVVVVLSYVLFYLMKKLLPKVLYYLSGKR